MTAWTGTAYEYFAIDSLDDLTASVLTLGATKGGPYPVTATHVTDDTTLGRLNTSCSTPLPAGRTRFWWSALLGIGQQISPIQGSSKIFGRLADAPESIPFEWVIYKPLL